MNEGIKSMGFHHIALKSTNLERSLKFYNALGLKEKNRWGKNENKVVMLEFGNGDCLEIFAGGEESRGIDKRFYHIAFCADDVDSAYKNAIAAGAKPKAAPATVSPSNAVKRFTMRIAFVYGPDGEIIEFFKEMV